MSALSRPVVTAVTPVGELLARRPRLARLFVELRMACPGCCLARFCTLREASRHYQLDENTLLQQLQERMD